MLVFSRIGELIAERLSDMALAPSIIAVFLLLVAVAFGLVPVTIASHILQCEISQR
jgi:putative effector of murein hydrolase LrgA (UPF0299 family)